MRFLYSLLAVSVLASGCAKAHAKTTPDAPLDVPLPPTRDVEPAESDAPPGVPLVTEPARNLPPRPRPAPAPPPRPETPRTETPRTEPPKPETPAEVKPVEEAPHPPTTLQTTPTTAEGDVERAIRATLTRATNELNRIDYRTLNPDARDQYDTAKRFIRNADEAVKNKNLVFAKTVADKAASIAAQLAGR